ncbi:MAG TPA: class I SAM-dependent methyltransferase [Candidatus Sulfotelmatobacter sp.]
MKPPKPDYGLDSPVIIAGLLVVGTISLAAGLLRPHLFGLPMRWIGIIAGAYCQQGAVSLVYYSRVGKLRMREPFLNSVPWRGDEMVLDIGCGRGLLLVAAAHRLTTGHAVGVDVWLAKAITGNRPNSALENAMLEGVRDRVEVKEADARKLPFPDGAFDIVVSNFVLHEVTTDADREKMVQEIARVLKPGGYVALRDFIFTDTCLHTLRQNGVDAKRARVGSLRYWLGAILNFGFFRLYHVTGRKLARERGV